MTETAAEFADRPRGEDVERPAAGEGDPEDVQSPRAGQSVEGHGPA